MSALHILVCKKILACVVIWRCSDSGEGEDRRGKAGTAISQNMTKRFMGLQ